MTVSVTESELAPVTGEKLATWGTIIHTDAAADIAAIKTGGRRVTIQCVGTFTSDNMEIHGSNDGTNYKLLNLTTCTATDGDNLPADFGTVLIGTLLERPRFIKPVPGASAGSGFSVVVTAYIGQE